MAILLSQAGGDAAVALLNDEDRYFLEDAVKAYTKDTKGNRSTIGSLAKELGVGRTYVYNLLKGNRIELSRLQQLHNVLGINILEDSQVDAYLRLESAKLSGRPVDFQWTSKCLPVRVDKFYLKNFLLPAIESQTGFFDSLYKTKETDGKFQVGVFEQEAYLLGKIIDYVKHALFGMDSDSLTEIDSDFYERDSNVVTPSTEIPITTSNGIWLDIEEDADDRMYRYYGFDENQQFFDKYGEKFLDIDFVDSLYKAKLDLLENGESDSEFDMLNNQLEFAVVVSKHKDFNARLKRVIDRISGFELEISNYCREKMRSPRRQSYFPLELQELSADLESGTFQLDIEPEIMAAARREALAATNGWKPYMGLDAMEDYL
jgi:transcriptional regulator with XRE-family HTH domain